MRKQNSIKILVATYPFGFCDPQSRNILEKTGWKIIYNSFGRRLKGVEVGNMIENCDGVIAGTEPYTAEILEKTKNLKILARVGIGLDNIDYNTCKKLGITVTFTPEAPSDSVADLTIAQIINLVRKINISNKSVKEGRWYRTLGELISKIKIGVLGVGRIGKKVIERLQPFGPIIYAYDIKPDKKFGLKNNLIWVEKDQLFSLCDLVTIHIPLNKKNYHYVSLKEFTKMKEGSYIINTSRGKIINEKDLEFCVKNKHLGGVALDVFEEEPYRGCLVNFDNVLLTAHIGASARYSRFRMEYEAAEDCIRVIRGQKPLRLVTEKDFE